MRNATYTKCSHYHYFACVSSRDRDTYTTNISALIVPYAAVDPATIVSLNWFVNGACSTTASPNGDSWNVTFANSVPQPVASVYYINRLDTVVSGLSRYIHTSSGYCTCGE